MAASGPAIPPFTPESKWLKLAHFCVPFAGLFVAIVSLVIRPEFSTIMSKMLNGGMGAIQGSLSGARFVSPRPDPLYDPVLTRILHGVQAATILGFVSIHRKWLQDEAKKLTGTMPIAEKTLQQFSRGWLYMWYGWFVLYAWFFFTASAHMHSLPSVAAISDVLDVVTGFAIWWCYLVLDLPSVKVEGDSERDRRFWRAVRIVVISGAICAFLGTVDELFDLGHVGVVVGLYNALALAFMTGRLGSHFMKTRRWILLCLYFYSMVQVFYSFLPLLNTAVWLPIVFLLALILKIAVAYAGFDLMQNGGLERYLVAAQEGKLDIV